MPQRIRDGLTVSTAFVEGDQFFVRDNPLVNCTNCGVVNRWEDMANYLCNECHYERSNHNNNDYYFDIPERLYSAQVLPQFQSSDHGKYITSTRVFSAELECYVPTSGNMRTIARGIPQEVGITSDGSLGDNGVEFQTPMLKGKNGETTLKDICKVLQAEDATVDKDCGLHIHLDGAGLLPKTITKHEPIALKQLWQFYIAFDEVMLSFLPISRRTNTFCRKMADTAKYAHIEKAKTQSDLETVWYKSSNRSHVADRKRHSKDTSRYHGINLHILFAEKHLEVRFHSGTINATKVLEWTALHQRICDLAAAGQLITSESMLALDLAQKTKMFFAILKLPARAEKYFERRQTQFKSKKEVTRKEAKDFFTQQVYIRTNETETNTATEDDLQVMEASA